ncbi:MAG: ROK family protein, partial [Myxococcota bacterium]
TNEELLGQAALKEVGEEVWNMRLRRAIVQIVRVFNPRLLYFGGGNARLVKGKLPENVQLAQNIAGLLGGIGLWRERR